MSLTKYTPRPAKQMDDYTPKPRTFVLRRDAPPTLVVPIPKSAPWRSEEYRRLVASLPCAHCGLVGYSNACHADQNKGMGIKSDDRTVGLVVLIAQAAAGAIP